MLVQLVGLFYIMTKDYEEYKANKGRHKTLKVISKVVEIVLIVGCVLAGLMFILMVAFPKGGWVEIFN